MHRFLLCVAGPLACLLGSCAAAQAAGGEDHFEARIRPVLFGTCLRCHGGEHIRGGLRVDSRAALVAGGNRGPGLVPRDAERSLLIKALRHTDDMLKMPPKQRLEDRVIHDFVAWVNAGAPWPETAQPGPAGTKRSVHWAYQPMQKPPVPGDATGWTTNPLDRFILTGLRREGLMPVAEASRATLARRLYFDLLGLPPTPEQLDAFVSDPAADAWQRLVDRLLASPHYGERWGRHWMDVVRYADTAGDNADYPIPEIHLYRDYIISAFNRDMPYDQFVREQLAGDILAKQGPPERFAEQTIATGFLALARRYGTGPYELWPLTLEDAIDTTGRAFLGLTLRCARCHDHKFDPVTTRDYYALYGIFASTQFPWAGSEEVASMQLNRMHFPVVVSPQEAASRLASHEKQLRGLEEEIKRLEKEAPKKQDELKASRARLRSLRKPGLPADLPGAYAVAEAKPVNVAVQLGGEEHRPGATVPRGVPAFLASPADRDFAASGSGRLELARWLTRADHPLTARVLVNRIWQHHFGKGLVGTPSNFGLRGEPPTHPELLDWLASRFMESGWSIKAVHRLILTSRTYRLACVNDEDNAARDAANRWYWRADRRRLEAEPLRDALLSVSGQLECRTPGRHPFPPIDSWGWTQHSPFKDVYASRQRSVYLMTQRLQRHPFMALFDGPDTNTTTDLRSRSTTPLQALFLMNNPFLNEQARAFAMRILQSAASPDERVALAVRLAWSRWPTPEESSASIAYIRRCREVHASEEEAWTSYARVVLAANEFIYLD